MGHALFLPKGTTHSEEGISDVGRHAILVDLKDVTVPPSPNTSGFPAAFPRDGAVKLIENARVVVWDYTGAPGAGTAMHFHDRDSVVVYLDTGRLAYATPDDQSTMNFYGFGQARLNPRGRTHKEVLMRGTGRAIAIELK